MTTVTTVDPTEVRRVASLDAEPILRNLLITQRYHDLSESVRLLTRGQYMNWCTFGTVVHRRTQERRDYCLPLGRRRPPRPVAGGDKFRPVAAERGSCERLSASLCRSALLYRSEIRTSRPADLKLVLP
jgi:hypothetical protein